MKYFPICFLLLMTCLVRVENVPIPGDCTTKPYREKGGKNENQDVRLHLDCTLSAINSESEKTNFSVIPGEHTASLTVRCSDTLSTSHIEPQGFLSLNLLEELEIIGCKLENIPDHAFLGLTRLRVLRLESSTTTPLSLAPGSMSGIGSLEHLDISERELELLHPSALCSIPSLSSLKLEGGSFSSLENLGLTGYQSSCLRGLRKLKLARNQISTLTSIQMQQLPDLEILDVSMNKLRYLDFDVFSFNPAIQILNLSGNSLRSLPPSLLPLPSLTTLSLANNSLTTLPSRILDIAANLTELDLSGNAMEEIKVELFENTTRLISINLSNNNIEKIRRKSFMSLHDLETLNLGWNKVEELPVRFGKPLVNLRTLDLTGNRIKSLANEVFLGLTELSHLVLTGNGLEEIGNLTLEPLTNLLLLDLSSNQLSQVPSSLKSLTSLQSLDLSHNQIKSLGHKEAVLPLPSLWRLNLGWNEVESVGVDQLVHLLSLQILDLSNNKIRDVERGAFSENTLLKAVRLDGNRLKRMENLFQDLPNLTWLNISDNRLGEFDYAMLPRSVSWLDLHRNELSSLENYFGLESGIQIKHLDAGFNKLKILAPVNLPNSVETVLLNDNELEELAPYTFYEKHSLKKVDLTVNKMSSIDRNSIRISPELSSDPSFLFGGNPLQCNCHMLWFRTINKKQTMNNLPKIADLESIYCRLPYSRQLTFAPLVDATPSQFLCPYQTHCFALCHCCDYDACDCEMACPVGCSCYHDATWNTNIVECSSSNFTDLPVKLPMDATELLLDGNNLLKLKSHTFIGRKNLRTLYLNNSNIEVLENNTFNGLPSMQFLDLHSNRIQKFQGDEFQGLVNLRELYLQNNLISTINNITFIVLKNLQILNLQGNRISEYTVWSLAQNQFLLSVGLTDNLWSCECSFLRRFTGWIQSTAVEVIDQGELRCTTADSSSIDLLTLEVCEEARGLVATEGVVQGSILAPAVAGGAAAVLLLLLLLLVVLYRAQFKLWLYSRYGIRFFQRVERGEDGEKVYDGFVVYSVEDDMYVQQVLASELELGANQFRLCLYHRDVSSTHFVADSILQACDSAKRTILVLSENLIKQEWSRYDFKSGVLQSLRSLGKKLIVILLGEIKLSDLDPELRCIVNSATLLNWGEHKFWEKVKFNLPERGDTGISQSTTLQSYPSTLHSFNSVLYQVPDIYEASPRYESAPGQPSLRPLLSPTSPDGLVSPGGVLTNLQTISRSKPGSVYLPATCLQNTFPHSSFRILHPVGDPSRDPTLLRDPCDLTQFRPPAYGTRTLRNQNLYSAQTNPRHIDHIYQVCM